MAVTMTLTLTLDGVTYGELYEFVDAVRVAGVPADERIRCVGSDDKGDRFEVELGPDRRRSGSGRAASAALVARPGARSDEPGPEQHSTSVPGATTPSATRVVETVRSMVRNGEDLDRVIAALGDLRRFLR